MVGEERDLLLGPLALGDVEHHALDQPRCAVVVVASTKASSTDPDHAAVLAQHPVLVEYERAVGLVRVLVLLPDALDVVLGWTQPLPAVRVVSHSRGRVAQEVARPAG